MKPANESGAPARQPTHYEKTAADNLPDVARRVNTDRADASLRRFLGVMLAWLAALRKL